MKDILKLLAEGQISLEDAERRLKLFAIHELQGMANLDIGRNSRVGKPDVVSAKGKMKGSPICETEYDVEENYYAYDEFFYDKEKKQIYQ